MFDTQTNPAFSLQSVQRRFGDKTVLRGINLTVQPGEFIAIIGKSGCGKSTLLRLLAGLDRPDAGRIEMGAHEAGHAGVRVMFQEPRLLPWERVLDNVALGLTGLADRDTARQRAAGLLAEVGLQDRADAWPAALSGGQRQRVALARALIGAPSVLALDEPLGALDALTRIEMQQLLERIWQEKRFAAVLVTHDVTEAVLLADRVVVLEEGRITLDLPIDLPRPRRHGSAEIAALEKRLLTELLGQD
ncbi:MAG: ABC transporter ATP-binding protein [Paracoccus sp. (in: a-proteobacteria)]|uniref:ABC transporter ATP-binding protein n=1 Tax=Paracoccus sp. TaxID=267 RepID=UPI0026DFCD15|nr:ABC transporter ATP-binding protein [Paracoccus sp. (in: a-proteobacteria)]MDO5632736.1 ABC transporter ATP-binding protein [Paracoccus sp. (in: a-proteobacteria)]